MKQHGEWIARRTKREPMADTTFDTIERKIADLVGMVGRLKTERDALAKDLEAKELEIRDLVRKMEDLKRERTEIRERVDTILSRLETVEL